MRQFEAIAAGWIGCENALKHAGSSCQTDRATSPTVRVAPSLAPASFAANHRHGDGLRPCPRPAVEARGVATWASILGKQEPVNYSNFLSK